MLRIWWLTFVPLGKTTYESFEDSFSTARIDRSSMMALTLHSSSASASNLYAIQGHISHTFSNLI
jgi:hypothetical protein